MVSLLYCGSRLYTAVERIQPKVNIRLTVASKVIRKIKQLISMNTAKRISKRKQIVACVRS